MGDVKPGGERALAAPHLDHLSCPGCVLTLTLFGRRWGLVCPVPSLVPAEAGTEGDPIHFLGAGCSVFTSEEGRVTAEIKHLPAQAEGKERNTTQQ